MPVETENNKFTMEDLKKWNFKGKNPEEKDISRRIDELVYLFVMYLLDSNIIIAYFRTAELDHKAAHDFIQKLDTFSICDYTLWKLQQLVLLKETKSDVEKVLEFLQKNKDVAVLRLSQMEMGEVLELFLKQKEKHLLLM